MQKTCCHQNEGGGEKMKRKFIQKLSMMGTVVILLSPVSLIPNAGYVSFAQETETSQVNLNQLTIPELKAHLREVNSANTETETVWKIDLTDVKLESEEMGIRLTANNGEKIQSLKVAEKNMSPDDNGFFMFAVSNSLSGEFSTKKGSSVKAELFKISGDEKVALGTVAGEDNQVQLSEESSMESAEKTESSTTNSNVLVEESTVSTESLEEQTETSSEESQAASSSTEEIRGTNDTSTAEESSTSTEERQVPKKASAVQRASVAALSGITGNPNIPKGAIELDGVFGKVNSSGNVSNSGVTAMHDPNQNNGLPYSEVSLSGASNWLSIWSAEQYKLDFSNSFHGRTYINFGNSAKDADGLAFVMQNEGPNALTKATNSRTDGQNLGVYGGSSFKGGLGGTITSSPETSAIKKSVAIEFDLYANAGGGLDYDYDNVNKKGLPIPHMAYSFPSNKDKGYRPLNTNWNGFFGGESPAIVQHNGLRELNGVVGDNIRDNTWYEFRYDFDKSSQVFSYYLKNPITGAKTDPVTIPWEDLNSELKLSENNNKTYWGFTGANGVSEGKVRFVFTQVPVDMSAKIENDVLAQDNSNKSLADDHDEYNSSIPAATGNEPLIFQTRFTVAQGEAALKIDKWEVNVSPKDIDLSKGVTDVQAKIDDKSYTGTAAIDQTKGTISVNFSDLKLSPGQDVYMTFNSQAIKQDVTTKSYFSSKVATTEVGNGTKNTFNQQISFWIKGNQAPVLSNLLTKDTFTDYLDTFAFNFDYRDNDSDTLSYSVEVNDNSLIKDGKLNGAASDQPFESKDNLKIDLLDPKTPFQLGDNVIKVTLSDGINESVQQEVHFKVEGYFGFEELTDNYAWKYSKTELKDIPTPMARQDVMKIKIRDTRNKETTPARVSFKAESEDKALLQDRFVFKGQDGEEISDLQIPVNKEKTYSKDEGLLLKLDNSDNSGVVNGTIQWTIVEAP